jgi:hypothetical protein
MLRHVVNCEGVTPGSRLNAVALLIISCLVAGSAWAAGVTVRAVVPPVTVVHDGDPQPITVTAGMVLAEADELIGGTVRASVQLECPNGATQTLSELFQAVINARSAKSRCAIDLKVGAAVATVLAATPDQRTDDDASISGGPYAMTSHHTQFGLAVTPGARADTEAFVIDGEASVSATQAAAPVSLKEGQSFNAQVARIARIPEQTFQRVATAYAQLDLAQLGPAATAQVAATLHSQWLAALKQPRNAGALKALAATHERLGLATSLVSKYQLARAQPGAGAVPAIATQFGNTFQNPMQGVYRLEYCLPNNQCGKPTAQAWCQAKGYAGAATWKPDYDIGAKTPTQRMGSRDFCARGPCDGFASITCE